jgi:hypothetical protein
MNAVAYPTKSKRPAAAIARRSDFSIALMQICLGISAEHYMVIDTACGPDAELRILASNWVYDAIEMVGLDHLAGLARSRGATPLGGSPEPLVIAQNRNGNSRICGDPESELARFGHDEIYALRLRAGQRSGCAFFSASAPGRIAATSFRRRNSVAPICFPRWRIGQATAIRSTPCRNASANAFSGWPKARPPRKWR